MRTPGDTLGILVAVALSVATAFVFGSFGPTRHPATSSTPEAQLMLVAGR